MEKGRHLCFVFNFYFNKSKTIPKIKHTKQVKGDASLGKESRSGGSGEVEQNERGCGAQLAKYFCVTLAENFILCIIYPVNNILQFFCCRLQPKPASKAGITKAKSHLAAPACQPCASVCGLV